jgi:hypothetical protein
VNFHDNSGIGKRRVRQDGSESAGSARVNPIALFDVVTPKTVYTEIFAALACRVPENRTFERLNIIAADIIDVITAGKRFTGHIKPASASV